MDYGELLRREKAGEISDEERQSILDEVEQRRIDNWPSQPESESVVYYIQFCCRIKIGVTNDVVRHAATLNADKVLATEPGDRSIERLRHEQFADARLQGEWFSMTPALMAHIKAVKRGICVDTRVRLIRTRDAVAYTQRDRHVLYRWAREGRITRHGRGKSALWDVNELPPCKPGQYPYPPPPFVRY